MSPRLVCAIWLACYATATGVAVDEAAGPGDAAVLSRAQSERGTEWACAACLTLLLTPEQGGDLARNLQASDSLDVLLSVTPSTPETTLQETLGTLGAKGVRVGLELPSNAGDWLPSAATLGLVDTVLVREAGGPRPSGRDTFVYRLKTRTTLLRAARDGLKIGLELGTPGSVSGAALAGYIDFLVLPPDRLAPSPTDIARWVRRSWSGSAAGREDALASVAQVPAGAERVLVDIPAGAPAGDLARAIGALRGRFALETEVLGRRLLSVQEILARHQARAARHARIVKTLISTGSFLVTFEVPGFTGPVTITSEAVVYTGEGVTDIEHRAIRVNGLVATAVDANGVPRLPLVDAEQVSAPPLAISLTEQYVYRLDGRDRMGDVDCYVVGFEPRAAGRSLFRGRAWIDVDGFALVRLAATETGLRGPITASEQIDRFVPVAPGDGPRRPDEVVWVLGRSEINQTYEGAGHRTPIQRVLTIQRQEVNAADFVARRAAAYASRAVMMRQTHAGLKYLRRTSGGPLEASPRQVVDRAQPVRALAFGVLVDPNISKPLPFAGVNYADFNLLGAGGQLNAFFGGTFGQVAAAWPSLAGTRWQVSGGASGTLARYNDRSFGRGVERYAENIRQRPANVSAGIARPVTSRTRVRAEYRLEITAFDRASTTAEAFVVPVDSVVHGGRFALEARRGPWDGSIWWHPARRQQWRPWGPAESQEYRPEHRDFQRFGAAAGRPLVLSPRVVGRLDVSAEAGRDLDRFSRYSVGTFENRVRGYPSASIRYDRGGSAHLALTWNPAPRLRLDGFMDEAIVRDPGLSRRAKGHTGLGVAVEAPLPWGVLMTVEWGYGVQARDPHGEAGTQVVRITGYRVF